MTTEQIILENKLTVVKTLGNEESFEKQKLVNAITKAIGFTNKSEIELVVNHVISKIDASAQKVTTAYINALVEGFMYSKSQSKDKSVAEVWKGYLKKYVDIKLKKQMELMEKVSHMQDVMSFAQMNNLKKFSTNQTKIAKERYLLKDLNTGEIKETIDEWFSRVAGSVVVGSILHDPKFYSVQPFDEDNQKLYFGGNELMKNEQEKLDFSNLSDAQVYTISETWQKLQSHMKYGLKQTIELINDEFYEKYQSIENTYFEMMYDGIFEPNTPTLLNAGTSNDHCSACFTIEVEDNMESIMGSSHDAAFIFKDGGGFGTNVEKIRPAGSNVGTTYNAATGPIDLVLNQINYLTDLIKAGGKRRGANMGILTYTHPQIMEFISYKLTPGKLENFNISVLFDAEFWNKYYNNEDIPLTFSGKVYDKINSQDLIKQIALNAWKSAEPGVLFKDAFNEFNPLRKTRGDIYITNPCSEQAMYPNESCTLGSINLLKFVGPDKKFDYEWFREVVSSSTRFLNDVLEINHYPTQAIAETSDLTKRIGLGVMGLADALFKMGIRYNSEAGYKFMKRVANILYEQSVIESINLAKERGACSAYLDLINNSGDTNPGEALLRVKKYTSIQVADLPKEVLDNLYKYGIRNMWTTTIAPTGTISMIANTSSSIEPIFALVYKKTVGAGDFYYLNDVFKERLIEAGIYSDELISKIEKNNGSVQGIDEVPCYIQDVFVTAMDMHWIDHIVAQSVWQTEGIDNAVSKTINMPNNATAKDIEYAYILAHELGLKGISVYRDGSRQKQVLHTNTSVESKDGEIGVAAIVAKIEKISKPSFASEQYIKGFKLNQKFMHELTMNVLAKKETQVFTVPNQPCIDKNCNGVLININNCMSCNLCGLSTKCIIG